MTLIVGIICKDGIVLAADSQTTKGISKLPGTHKISVIQFADSKALVAEAGSAGLSNKAIQIIQHKAIGVKMDDEFTVASIVEQSVREIRVSLTGLHPENISPTDWQDFFSGEANYFELMVGYYFGDKPCLYTFNPLWCIPVPATSFFKTCGIASDLANYILKEHAEPEMDAEFASVIAIKVVEDAIEYVEGCGCPTRVAIISKPVVDQPLPFPSGSTEGNILSYLALIRDPVVIFPQTRVEEIAKIVTSVEKNGKNTQNKKIHHALRNQTKKEFKKMAKDLGLDLPTLKKYE